MLTDSKICFKIPFKSKQQIRLSQFWVVEMFDLKDELKRKEKEIVVDAYKITLAKQDIALGLVESVKETFKGTSNKKINNEEIADLLFEKIKEIPNKEIMQYLQSEETKRVKLRLKIEKRIIESIM